MMMRGRRIESLCRPTSASSVLACLAVLALLLALVEVKDCSASPHQLSNYPRIVQRTTWPSETGTMVRILKKKSSLPAAEMTSMDDLEQEELHRAEEALLDSLEAMAGHVDRYSRQRRNNLFLRTSRAASASDEMIKRAGGVPKRDKSKSSNPFLFRTSKRASPASMALPTASEAAAGKQLTEEERRFLENLMLFKL